MTTRLAAMHRFLRRALRELGEFAKHAGKGFGFVIAGIVALVVLVNVAIVLEGAVRSLIPERKAESPATTTPTPSPSRTPDPPSAPSCGDVAEHIATPFLIRPRVEDSRPTRGDSVDAKVVCHVTGSMRALPNVSAAVDLQLLHYLPDRYYGKDGRDVAVGWAKNGATWCTEAPRTLALPFDYAASCWDPDVPQRPDGQPPARGSAAIAHRAWLVIIDVTVQISAGTVPDLEVLLVSTAVVFAEAVLAITIR